MKITAKGEYQTKRGGTAILDGKDGRQWLGEIGKLRSRWEEDGTNVYHPDFDLKEDK